jgi:Chromate transporter.
VFGGGHVVLPLLQAQVVPAGMDNSTFLAGYGAAQAVPGPLFTFAAFLGAASAQGPGGWLGAGVALLGFSCPAFCSWPGPCRCGTACATTPPCAAP